MKSAASRKSVLYWLALTVPLCVLSCSTPKTDRDSKKPQSSSADQRAASDLTPKLGPIYLKLANLAKAQAKNPQKGTAPIPLPPGVDPALLTHDPNPSDKELTSLQKVIDDLAWTPPTPPKPIQTQETDTQSGIVALKQSNALRLYVAGRTKRLEGDIPGALSDFEAATRLDPDAGEPWRELGETQLQRGSRRLAVTSFANALKRGVISARILEAIGRHELEQHDLPAAAGHLAAASLYASESSDKALTHIVHVELAQVLKQLGYSFASMDSLQKGLRLPDRFASSTRYYAELNDLYRRRGDLWIDVGDMACRLGRFSDALSAYRHAAALPTLDTASVTARAVYAAMQSGMPAVATVALLDDLYQSGGRPEQRHTDLIRYTATHSGLGPKIADAIKELQADVQNPITPSTLSGLVRARAASLSTPEARRLLRRHLKSTPSDLRAFAAFLDTFDPYEIELLTQEIIRITESNPHQAPHYAASLYEHIAANIALIEELSKHTSSLEARLLEAYLHARRSSPQQGFALLPLYADRQTPALMLAQVELAAASGHWRRAKAALQQLDENTSVRHRAARSHALRALQRNEEALEMILPLLDNPGVSIPDRLSYHLDAAEYNFSMRRANDAERLLLSAIELDASDDRAFERLVALYSRTGPLADATKLTQTVRSLRQASPSSRLLRWIRAQELVRQSLWSEAQRYLASLAQELPSDRRVIDLLTIVWEQQSAAGDADAIGRAETWLRRQLEEHQDLPSLLSGLAGVLVSDGRPEEAESLLKEVLAHDPHPDVARTLEWVLRDHLDRADEANALVRSRLEGRIRSIEEGLELANLLVRINQRTEALIVLRHDLPDDINYRADQIGQFHLVLSRLISADTSFDDAAQTAPFFELAQRKAIPLTASLHRHRFNVLANKLNLSTDQIYAASKLAQQQLPASGMNMFMDAAKALIAAKQHDIALDLIARTTAAEQDPPVELVDFWFNILIYFGSRDAIETFVTRNQTTDDVRTALSRFDDLGVSADASLDSLQAELAYKIGVAMMSVGRPAQANEAMRFALKIDPLHILANNDLGYFLADADQDLEQALGMIQTAYKQDPQSPSIQDSLGWVLYKLGKLHDAPDQAGGPTTPGAISMLIKATQSDNGQYNPVILDHLGDAFWIAGQPQQAIQAWRSAESLIIRELQEIQNNGKEPQKVAPSRVKLLAQIRAKHLAADARQEPQVANHRPITTDQ